MNKQANQRGKMARVIRTAKAGLHQFMRKVDLGVLAGNFERSESCGNAVRSHVQARRTGETVGSCTMLEFRSRCGELMTAGKAKHGGGCYSTCGQIRIQECINRAAGCGFWPLWVLTGNKKDVMIFRSLRDPAFAMMQRRWWWFNIWQWWNRMKWQRQEEKRWWQEIVIKYLDVDREA